MLKEFRDFVLRGNVLDLAVAVILGTAFSAIIASLVDDIIMPIVGVLLGGVDFTSLAIQIGEASITYGNFIQAVVNFLIVAFFLFMIVRSANQVMKRFARQEEAAAVPPSEEVVLLTEIRDLLRRGPVAPR